MKFPRMLSLATALGMAALLNSDFPTRAADDPFAWPPITSQTKPWAFNWWMGSAVDKTNLTHELERYAAGGLGGIHIIPIYGAKGFEDKYIPYLSPKWMEMMGWTVSEAHRLDMGVDMTLGTGWCFGGPTVSDEDANASVVVKTFDVAGGEKLTEKFNRDSTQALMAFAPGQKPVELTGKISADGSVDWSAPAGSWKIYAISQKPSGQKVKRAAPGGAGWMLNPLYPQAIRDWLPWFDDAFKNYHGPKPRAVYQDSYEYRTDWSPDFFAQFEKLRGYKLQDELPALFSKNPDDHAARVLCDYRETVSEIMAGESEPVWIDWAHKNGFLTRYQAHGSPGNWLDLYADADIPETEFFSKHRNILVSKFASSAAHVKGDNLVSSESCTWMDEHFTETLGEVKSLMDELFLSGINHVFYHGLCYSPDEAGWPGWHFYASTEMNPRNSIWRDAPAVNEYIARVQSVLQSGKSDNDILLYWPIEDFWMQPGDQMLPQFRVEAQGWFEEQPIGKIAHELWDKGYAFDYVSDAQLKTAKVADGKIQMPGGNYKVIVVPECKYMPVETFKQLFALAENGATVIFEKGFPIDVSGVDNLDKQREEFKKIKSMLKPHWTGRAHPIGYEAYDIGGGIVFTARMSSDSGIKSLEYENEVACEPMVESGLFFVRRSFEGGWNYFIVNRSETNFDGWISLGRPVKSAVALDPMTGNAQTVGDRESQQIVSHAKQNFVSTKDFHLQLKPGESVIFRAFDHWLPADKAFPFTIYWQTNDAPTEITGAWNVKFTNGGPTLPEDAQISKLASWTTFADTNCQTFGGTAKYEITFDAPNSDGQNYFLNLGDVRQSARVKLNGKDYGTLITPPFRVVVDNLQPTGNKLEVEVTSVDANRIRDLDRRGVKWKIFRDINFVDINYKPFDASNWPLTDCGLLGPVTLTPLKD